MAFDILQCSDSQLENNFWLTYVGWSILWIFPSIHHYLSCIHMHKCAGAYPSLFIHTGPSQREKQLSALTLTPTDNLELTIKATCNKEFHTWLLLPASELCMLCSENVITMLHNKENKIIKWLHTSNLAFGYLLSYYSQLRKTPLYFSINNWTFSLIGPLFFSLFSLQRTWQSYLYINVYLRNDHLFIIYLVKTVILNFWSSTWDKLIMGRHAYFPL